MANIQPLLSELIRVNDQLEAESELREKIKEAVKNLDKQARTTTSLVNRVHATQPSELSALSDNIDQALRDTRPMIAEIVSLIPANEFFKWQPLYTKGLQSLIFAAALAEFVRCESLIEMSAVCELLGINAKDSDRFALLPEDYLHGIISMVNELSRLAVNSVTLQNYAFPLKISSFVGELFAGYQLLNLKNDSLRRRFDSLKYDLKKIEEVVYDISLRGLTANKPTTTPEVAMQ